MENLLEARISLRVTEDEIKRARLPNNDWLQDIVVLQFANLGNLMNGIRNVRYMKVCADTLEVVSLCCESMPVFNNLKSLTIENNMRRAWQAWQALPAFLRNSPHIETLILEDLLQHVTHKCGDACDCISREVKGRSLTTCPIKVLKIQECQGTMKELRMIKHFLVYLPCLKEIEIYIKRNGITQLRVPEVSEAIAEMIELNNKLSSCNVQLLVNGCLYKKWTAQ